MPTNPPTPADRLAAIVEELFTNGSGEHAQRLVLLLPDGRDGGGWNRAAVRDRLTALLAADPPGATVVRVCSCGLTEYEPEHQSSSACHSERCGGRDKHHRFVATTARVSYTRALTEEEKR